MISHLLLPGHLAHDLSGNAAQRPRDRVESVESLVQSGGHGGLGDGATGSLPAREEDDNLGLTDDVFDVVGVGVRQVKVLGGQLLHRAFVTILPAEASRLVTGGRVEDLDTLGGQDGLGLEEGREVEVRDASHGACQVRSHLKIPFSWSLATL